LVERGSKTPDSFLHADGIRSATFVRCVEIHETLGSTNERALELLRDSDIDLPALVIARFQTAGKGRGRNSWWAAEGALTFSLVLDAATTGIVPANWPQLSLATAVAICDALTVCLAERIGASPLPTGHIGLEGKPTHITALPRLQIKWPNDVLLLGRKVSGILIESPSGSSLAKERLIMGIGINVNNSCHDAPGELSATGTALCDFRGERYELRDVLVRVLDALAKRIHQLRSGDKRLVRDWQSMNYLVDRRIVVQTEAREFDGKCEGIADDGALLLGTPSGPRRIYSGSIRLA
jgi:BirA family biotin operon repressor/biotin-[acetyl-CoA-carboxylase] ligase